ncbi:siderophore-interacting protein [Aquabacterium sp. A7-Y]|uniref:siderophore-interacting protein n=1 Tax=Aquabacterium sp. A7-Y TaxID=1349605 RepID=UPI00223E735C|nr:siderophore-interacting protein [Aquabacterium sp. A7-Y]MCW7539442.1 siderophore-interacting protein [Aquabacterium sp. A7-Y]
MTPPAPGRTPPRLLRVRRSERVTPEMQRVTLAGPALAGFPEDSAGAHIKLMFPRQGQAEPVLPTLGPDGPVWPPAPLKPILRTYTVARYDAAAGELDVDFVLHGDEGVASRWAARARSGDAIGLAGPGGPARFCPGADWHLVIGDPSSLAMVQSVLDALPPTARGYALLEVPNRHEIRPLAVPGSLELRWLSREGAPAGDSRLLLHAVQRLPWLHGRLSVSLAGESTQVVAIRDHLLVERGVARGDMYAVPYWKDRHTEEAYHEERHRLMDEVA